jgi:threonine/homoserine/homoserine lactone efflux protein
VLTYFLIGVAIGAVTGVPIGPVNVAVIDAAFRHTMRRAVAVGLGGAVADGLYASAGILGVGPWLVANPSVPPVLYGISGLVLIVYGVLTARTQPVAAAPADVPQGGPTRNELWSGFTVGLLLIVLNPAAIVTWVLIVGSFLGDVDRGAGIGAVLGIFVGSFGWFMLVAFLTHRGKHLMGDKAVWIPRVVGVALVLYGIYSLGRALKYAFT